MLIDTHCHLSFKAFNDTWPDVVKRARDKYIQMICVGAAKGTSAKSIAIVDQSDPAPNASRRAGKGVFAAIGLHPTHTDEVFDYDWFEKAAENPKVVAIGETGIDHYHIGGGSREVVLKRQEDLLREHLVLARDKKLPVILHSRDGKTESLTPPPTPSSERRGLTAYQHLYQVLTDFGYFNCVLHCYGGDWETAKKFLDLGLMLSFTGIVTYKNASDELKEVVRNIPLDRFMVETDSPYLAPEPYRGKQNEPAFVEYVARGIAQIRGAPYEEIVEATTVNAVKFFKL